MEVGKQFTHKQFFDRLLTLCFIGLLVLFITLLGGSKNPVSIYVVRISAVMLIVMAGLTLLTGARTSIVPIKICPIVKTIVAILFFLGIIGEGI